MNAPQVSNFAVSGSDFAVVCSFTASFMRSPFPVTLMAKDAGLVDQRAQRFKFLFARRRNRVDLLRRLYLEAGIGLHVLDGDAWKQHCQPRFQRFRIEVEDA